MCVLLLLWSACGESRSDAPAGAAAPECRGAKLPERLDPRSVSWELVVPPHGTRRPDRLIDACDHVVSLAHDEGSGGKVLEYGSSQVLATSDGVHWSASEIQGVEGATFFDLATGAGRWVAVGRSQDGGGVIAFADAFDSHAWRAVFTSSEWPFEHVAFGANTFVAQSRFGVAVSPDAEHWHWAEKLSSKAQYFDIAFGNGHFVLAGVGQTANSSDAEVWSMSFGVNALQQVAFVGDKFYAFGGSGSLESSDGVSWKPVVANIPDAAVGGLLVSMASDVEAHFVLGHDVPDPPRVFVSEDGGRSYPGFPLTVRESGIDCSRDACVVVPQGVLVLRAKDGSGSAGVPLCDGSPHFRLAYNTGPGFGEVLDWFKAPYGSQFFAIDGACRYWAQVGPVGAIVTGTLTPEQATQLSADLRWDELPGWGNYHPKVQCADAGGVRLGTERVALTCGPQLAGDCGCGAEAPKDLANTLSNAAGWLARLMQMGTPLSGEMGALALRFPMDVPGPLLAWPLSRSMVSIPNLIAGSVGSDPGNGLYARFDDPAEAALLRKLRTEQPANPRTVHEGSQSFALYLRDELPRDTTMALTSFFAAWQSE